MAKAKSPNTSPMKATKTKAKTKTLSAYNLYFREHSAQLKESDPTIVFADIAKNVSLNWREMSEHARAPYVMQALKQKNAAEVL